MIATASFETAWAAAKRVRGWLNQCEARALYDAAISTPEDGSIIEIGAFCGKSTTLLAETGRFVLTIDPLEIGDHGDVVVTQDCVDSLQSVVNAYSNVRWLRVSSRHPALARSRQYDMLYIDGNHNWPEPHKDFERFRNWLTPNAVVAFHDYDSEPGVTQAVGMLQAEGLIRDRGLVGSMYTGELI